MERHFDLIVVGGGHAGAEAAHAGAKLGLNTLLLTNNIDQIASMPCNPAIGGPAKSHLVKEIDALGGLMALAADATYIQLKTLNSSKGPAVRALRAQSDKKQYSNWVREYLENLPNLTLYQSSAKALLFDKANNSNYNTKVIGVETQLKEKLFAKSVVLTAGTFLEGRIFTGCNFQTAGRAGEQASVGLSPMIQEWGLNTGRLKTGTPARLDRKSIDFSVLEEAWGDQTDKQDYFSFLPNRPVRMQYPCHITRTNEKTHEIINRDLMKSPMYSGEIDANGPRYCPSIEDKVVRFPHNPSHHFFLEPEGLDTNEIYLQGCSTSLPIETQWDMIRTLPGLEEAVITRPAYAVEYDYFPGVQFKHSFESKSIENLFVAGQVLGTSGYEEAAAQGLMAGINATLSAYQSMSLKEQAKVKCNNSFRVYANEHQDFTLDRSSSYIATLVDDLVTKEISDPYRMLTSRSEYRLLLRQDNADQRLTPTGRKIGLVDDYRWQVFENKQERMQAEIKYLQTTKLDIAQLKEDTNQGVSRLYPELNTEDLEKFSTLTTKAGNKLTFAEILKQHEFNTSDFKHCLIGDLDEAAIEKRKAQDNYITELQYGFEAETEIKYEGYIKRQNDLIKRADKYEKIKIPDGFDYNDCKQLSLETKDKLTKIQPKTLAQASRVGGITPSDISLLSIILEQRRRAATLQSSHGC